MATLRKLNDMAQKKGSLTNLLHWYVGMKKLSLGMKTRIQKDAQPEKLQTVLR